MFNNYYVGSVKGEEVLYLYIDDAYEFAKLDTKGEKKSFVDKIIDCININKINFNGRKIVIVVNGLILGTFFLAAGLNGIHVPVEDSNIYVDKIFLNSYNEHNKIEDITEIEPKNKEEDKLVINDDNKTKEDNTEKKGNINTNTGVDESKNTEKNAIPEVKQEKEQSSNENASNHSNEQAATNHAENLITQNENKIVVTIYRSNGTVLEIELEEYLIGVVASEMPASFHIEALKAQAIIARTYALKAMEKGTVLTDTVSTQVYKDNNELKEMWKDTYSTYYNKVKDAVTTTAGIKIKYNGSLIEALYFSCSNGYTEDASNVWGNLVPYLKSIENNWDISASAYSREVTFTYSDLSRLLGLNIDDATSFSINSKNESNRISSVSISYKNYTGVELRTKLSLRSADFDIDRVDGGLKFTTRGYGHGVGLSQYGANSMANAGYNYSQIIHYYYQGVSIVK